MRLRVAKKVELGRQCTGVNCHRKSTVSEAARLYCRALERGSRLVSSLTIAIEFSDDGAREWFFGDGFDE